jgi:VanZ like family
MKSHQPPIPPGGASRVRAVVLSTLTLLFVSCLTLVPAPVMPGQKEFAPFLCLFGCGGESVRDAVSNTLLFIPVGWSARYWLRRHGALVLCLVATITIEALQTSVISGRDASLRDVLTNVLGGALGIWLWSNWRSFAWPDRTRSLRLALIGTGGCLSLLVFSGLGMHSTPTSGRWYGNWDPDLPQYARYPGQLLSAGAAGWTPPNGLMPEPVPFRDAMRDNEFSMTVRVVSGPRPASTAAVFGIFDDLEQEQFMIGQDRSALRVHTRTAFEAWGLRGLLVRLPLFPGREPGDSLTVVAGVEGRAWVLRAISRGKSAEVRVPLTVGLGWTGLLPFRYPVADEWLVINPIWLGALVMPIGYWIGRGARAIGIGLLAGVLVGGLVAVPYLARAAPTTSPEWLGAALGMLTGWGLGLLSRRHGPDAPLQGG